MGLDLLVRLLTYSCFFIRYHDQFLSSVNMREQAVRPKGQQQDSSSDSSPLGGRREADRITPRYEQMELGESQEALVRPRSLWSRFWRPTPRRGRPRVTFADDEASAHGRADAHGTIDELPLSVLSRENANSARLFMRHLDQLEAALRHKERDVWKVRTTIRRLVYAKPQCRLTDHAHRATGHGHAPWHEPLCHQEGVHPATGHSRVFRFLHFLVHPNLSFTRKQPFATTDTPFQDSASTWSRSCTFRACES